MISPIFLERWQFAIKCDSRNQWNDVQMMFHGAGLVERNDEASDEYSFLSDIAAEHIDRLIEDNKFRSAA